MDISTTDKKDRSFRLDYEMRRELASRARPGSLIYALCLALSSVLTGHWWAHPNMITGQGFVLIAFGVYRSYLINNIRDEPAWDKQFLFCCLGLNLGWSVPVAYFTTGYGMTDTTYLLLLVTAGLCSGGTNTLAPDRKILQLSQLALMLPELCALFSLGSAQALGVGILATVYAVYLVVQGIGLHRNLMLSRETQLNLKLKSLQLEEAHRVKDDFLANVSHEIRTPMNGIIGMTDEVLLTELSENQRRDLSVVKTSARSLLSIINQILDFSKIEAGKLPSPVTEPFSLDQLLHDCLRPLSLQATKKGLLLFYQIEPELSGIYEGDAGRIRQILTNLVANSLKFTASGSISVSVSEREQQLIFEVKDTGIGIAEDKLESIFDPFSQSDTSLTRQHEGTGLGLSIVRRLVDSLNGELTLQSQINKGTTVGFSCPQAQAKDSLSQPLAGLKVILLDGITERAACTQKLLLRWGADVRIEQSEPVGISHQLLLLETSELEDEARNRLSENNTVVPLVHPLLASQIADAINNRKPLDPSPPPKSQEEKREPSDSAHVLLVEDHDINRAIATRILERSGYRVTPAENGQIAVELFHTGTFDIILMDIQMPVLDGYQATARIRASEGGTKIPIIALTAHAVKGDREKCLAAGMDDYLTKPLDRQSLLDKLSSVRHL